MAQMTGLPEWMKKGRDEARAELRAPRARGFTERNLASIASFLKESAASGKYSKVAGLLQGIGPGARIFGVLLLVAAGAVTAEAVVLAAILCVTVFLAALSRVSLRGLALRVLPAFLFTLVLVVPVFFSFVTPGAEIFGFNTGGVRVAVTEDGTLRALFFLLRVTAMVSPVSLLVMTTGQADFFRGLRKLPVPAFFSTALFMTFRYIFILLKTAEDVNLARRSRTITRAKLAESQRWFASRAAFLLKKSLGTAEEVTMAMASRGFTGRMRTFDNGRLRGWDLLWLGFTSFVFFLSLRI